jgi:leader peptidase (prepilin peptidase)/N-methyltransferase
VFAGIAAAGAAALVWRLPTGQPSDALHLAAWLAFTLGGILLCGIDIAVHRLPTVIIGIVAIVDVGLNAAAAIAAGQPGRIATALLAGAVIGGGYLVLALLAPGQLGLGDVRLAALVGLVLGASGWPAALLGAALPHVLVIPFALVRLRLPKGSAGRRIAFGPFLIAGAMLTALLTG